MMRAAACGTLFAMDPFAVEPIALGNRMSVVCLPTSGALIGLLLTGCGLSITPQPAPAVPSPTRGLQRAPP